MAGESKKGKLKSAVKVIENGQHAFWEKNGKNNYNYTVIFVDDKGIEDVGTASKQNDNYPWEKEYGENFTYTRVVRGQNNQYVNFYSLKNLDAEARRQQSRSGGGYKKTPEDEASIMVSVAIECATLTKKESTLSHQMVFNDIYKLYVMWLFDRTYIDGLKSQNVQAALRRAVMAIGTDDIQSGEDVILRAKDNLTKITEIQWVINRKAQLKGSQPSQQEVSPPQTHPQEMISRGSVEPSI